MKKFFYTLLVLVLSIFSVNAQSQNSQEKMQTLVQRVDSLEHELSYLKLTYELSTLNSDMTLFSNAIDIKTLEIQLNLDNRNFNSLLGYAYQRYYKSCQEKKQSISELIEAKKKFFVLKVITYPFSESEMNTLKASYNVIDKAYESIGNSMELLKIVVDAYNKSLQQFANDIEAMEACDVCVMVLPCGRSAHTEAGWFAGKGKTTIAYIPENQEPELMYKLFSVVCCSMDELIEFLNK